MAKPQSVQNKRDDKRPAPRLYLVTPVIEDAAAFSGTLRDALAAADIAAVLLRLKPAGERDLINRIKVLAPAGAGEGHRAAARRMAGARRARRRRWRPPDRDRGVHGRGRQPETREDRRLRRREQPRRYDARRRTRRGLRDDGPHRTADAAERPPFDAIVERIEWWSELFTVPCVGFAASLAEIAPLAAAGADFVAIGDAIWDDPRGALAALAEASRLLAPEPV